MKDVTVLLRLAEHWQEAARHTKYATLNECYTQRAERYREMAAARENALRVSTSRNVQES